MQSRRYNPRITSEDIESMNTRQYLWRLPNLPALPTIRQDGYPSTIALIPLFKRNDEYKAFTQSALWAWYTLYQNADANDHNIAVYFYVERRLEYYVKPILGENGIDWDEHVRTMPNQRTEGFNAQKMSMYYDEQFKDYEYIYSFDADTFIGASDGQKLAFFNRPSIIDGMGFGLVRSTDPDPLDLFINRFFLSIEHSGDRIAILKDKLRSIGLDPDVVFAKVRETKFTSCSGWITCFPSKHFHENYPSMIDYFRNASQLFGCDETMLRVGMILNDLECYTLVTDDIPWCIHHDRIPFIEEREKDRQPYILHGSENTKWEQYWLRHMGGKV